VNWKQKAEAYRLQQMRAHQLREQPPVPERRERKQRPSPLIFKPPVIWFRADLSEGWISVDVARYLLGFNATSERAVLYEEAFRGF